MRYGSKVQKAMVSTLGVMGDLKLVLGLVVVVGLSIISMMFNYMLGGITATDEVSALLLPKGYALLDVALVFLCGMLAVGIKSDSLRLMSKVWCVVLLALSLWSCFAFVVAVDSQRDFEQSKARVSVLESNLELAERRVKLWSDKLEKTVKHSSRFDAKLQESISQRDDYLNQIEIEKDKVPSPALAVFHVLGTFLGKMSIETFQLIVRFIWGAALIISPILCMSVLASEVKAACLKKPQTVQTTTNETAPKKRKQTAPFDELKYMKIKKKVQSGEVKPSSRSLKTAFSIADSFALECLRRMESEGILSKGKRDYKLAI